MEYDKNKNWVHYLTRPFTLFGASLWQEWYASDSTKQLIGAQMNNALFVEQEKGVVRCYRTHEELDAFKKAVYTLIADEEKASNLLQLAQHLNDEAKSYISGAKTFQQLEEAVMFLTANALHATIIPYWILYFKDALHYSDQAMVSTAENLRGVSYYNGLIEKCITPIAKLQLKMNGLDEQLVEWYTYHELVTFDIHRKIQESNTPFVYQITENTEQVFFVQRPLDIIHNLESFSSMNQIIKGQTAYNGKVRGKVTIILKPNDTKPFHDGDILVTTNCNPSFMPFIQKAGGLITDEGGIMCHAAIISRELQKPCITGTKNASHTLHDGQEVELDADQGTVTIL